jgi:hypothetical protein
MREGQVSDNTVRFLAEQFGAGVSHGDARACIASIAGFFAILAEWEARKASDLCHATSDGTTPLASCVSEELPPPFPNPPVVTTPKEGVL